MTPIAVTLNVDTESLGMISTIILVGASVLGYLIYQAHKSYKGLVDKDAERTEKTLHEEQELREQLLSRYKELYELEKQRSLKEMEDIRKQLTLLQNELEYMRARLREVQEENDKLRELNVRYQQNNRIDGHMVRDLRQSLALIHEQVEKLGSRDGSPAMVKSLVTSMLESLDQADEKLAERKS